MRTMSMQKLRLDRIRVTIPFNFWLLVCTDLVAVSICNPPTGQAAVVRDFDSCTCPELLSTADSSARCMHQLKPCDSDDTSHLHATGTDSQGLMCIALASTGPLAYCVQITSP
jgi:hypothetical protein